MSISENIYYLKDDNIIKLEDGGNRSVSLGEVLESSEKMSLLIDDKYFFYIGMESVSVTGRKLHDIAKNYLNMMLPGEMIKSFGVYQTKDVTVIFIVSVALIELIKNNRELFDSAKKISTPFFELILRYEDFIFSDGDRFYRKNGSTIVMTPKNGSDFITSSDLFDEITEVKNSVKLPGVAASQFSKAPLALPIATLAICYILFVIGGFFSAGSIGKLGAYYDNELMKHYEKQGVSKAKDPYGMLISKSKFADGNSDGKRTLEILNDISGVTLDGVNFSTLSIRDKAVRVDGSATDFAQVDALKKQMEEKLKVPVAMDDTKKTAKGVTFIMRYEQ